MNSTTYYNQRVQLSCSQLLDFVEKWNIGVKDLIYTFNLDEGHWIEMEQYRKSSQLANKHLYTGKIVAFKNNDNAEHWSIGLYSKKHPDNQSLHLVNSAGFSHYVEHVRDVCEQDHLDARDLDNLLPAYKHNDMKLGDFVWCLDKDVWALHRFAEYTQNGIKAFDPDETHARYIEYEFMNVTTYKFKNTFHFKKLPWDAKIQTDFRRCTFDLIDKTNEWCTLRDLHLKMIKLNGGNTI